MSTKPDSGELPSDPEQMLARERAELARHNEEMRQFAYAISHDLREPLRMVASYTQLLSRRYQAVLDDEGREFMRFIVEGAHKMDRLVGDLLMYSQQFRSADEALTLVDAEGVLEGLLLSLEPEIRESRAQITHDPLPQVLFNFARLTQVFRQLIGNAIKFHGPEPPRLHISASEGEDGVTFVFRDNGIGIDPSYHEQIFGVFKRLHGSDYPGTGIGLAVCKRIVDQQGGRIWVESEAGHGAIFRFTLPQ